MNKRMKSDSSSLNTRILLGLNKRHVGTKMIIIPADLLFEGDKGQVSRRMLSPPFSVDSVSFTLSA